MSRGSWYTKDLTVLQTPNLQSGVGGKATMRIMQRVTRAVGVDLLRQSLAHISALINVKGNGCRVPELKFNKRKHLYCKKTFL